VLADLAVMIADGGEAICDIDVLRHQGKVFGQVASDPTVWRAVDEIGPASTDRNRYGNGADPGTGRGRGLRAGAARRVPGVGGGLHDRPA
jgi:hypothetical protein